MQTVDPDTEDFWPLIVKNPLAVTEIFGKSQESYHRYKKKGFSMLFPPEPQAQETATKKGGSGKVFNQTIFLSEEISEGRKFRAHGESSCHIESK